MSELQCAILLCMNDGGVTLRALETMLGVESTDLAKHLTPMVRGKHNILQDGKGNELTAGLVEDTSTLRINKSYQPATGVTKIKLPVGLGKVKGSKKSSGGGSSTSPRPTPRSAASAESSGGVSDDVQGAAGIAGSNDTTSSEVRESRKVLSDTTIVKIMKRRQKSKLRPLIEEVKKSLAYMWNASGQELSKRVEDLIERDYLERDEEDQTLLLYVP